MFELGFIIEKSNENVDLGMEVISFIKTLKDTDTEHQVKFQDLKTILTAILNFEFDWMLCSEASKDAATIGSFDTDGNYKLTSREISHLHKRFFQLVTNRQDYNMKKRAERKAEKAARGKEAENLGKPSLNSKSMQIIKDKVPNTTNYADYLIQRGIEYEKHK